MDTSRAIELAVQAHRRLIDTVTGLDDLTARRPSRLPIWTVGHVLTHLARNADGHVRRLQGALRGEDVPRYDARHPRDADVEAGAGRPAAELAADVTKSARRLERTWAALADAGWPNAHLTGGDQWTIPESPVRRLREVEMHHVDLGLGYEPANWPQEYVVWELPEVLRTVPRRLPDPDAQRNFLAWLAGRADHPGTELGPWI